MIRRHELMELQMDTTDKRAELKSKIEAAEQRNAERSFGERARDAAEEATSFVKEHPLATVAGGIVIGAIIASIVPGPGKRMRKKASARGALVAGALTDLAIKYGAEILEGATKAAKTGQDRLGDLGETLCESAREASRSARKTARGTLGDLRSRFH